MADLTPIFTAVFSAWLQSPVMRLALLMAVLVMVLSVLARTAWFKGLIGEWQVRVALRLLLDARYRRMHDITLRTPDGSTQIDHVVGSPFGIFVIETKNYRGWIFGSPNAKTWTQSIFGRKFTFQNPLHQNFKHLKAIEATTAIPFAYLHSVVVFVGDSTFKTPMPPNVTNIGGMIRYIKSKQDVILSDGDIAFVFDALQR